MLQTAQTPKPSRGSPSNKIGGVELIAEILREFRAATPETRELVLAYLQKNQNKAEAR